MMKRGSKYLPIAALIASLLFLGAAHALPAAWAATLVAVVAIIAAILAVSVFKIGPQPESIARSVLTELILFSVWGFSTFTFVRRVVLRVRAGESAGDRPEQLITISAGFVMITVICFGTSRLVSQMIRSIRRSGGK
jgi:hypothetical protein